MIIFSLVYGDWRYSWAKGLETLSRYAKRSYTGLDCNSPCPASLTYSPLCAPQVPILNRVEALEWGFGNRVKRGLELDKRLRAIEFEATRRHIRARAALISQNSTMPMWQEETTYSLPPVRSQRVTLPSRPHCLDLHSLDVQSGEPSLSREYYSMYEMLMQKQLLENATATPGG